MPSQQRRTYIVEVFNSNQSGDRPHWSEVKQAKVRALSPEDAETLALSKFDYDSADVYAVWDNRNKRYHGFNDAIPVVKVRCLM